MLAHALSACTLQAYRFRAPSRAAGCSVADRRPGWPARHADVVPADAGTTFSTASHVR